MPDKNATCICAPWVTGGLQFDMQKDQLDGRVVEFVAKTSWPKRTAVSTNFQKRLEGEVPGAAIWEDKHLVIRTTDGKQRQYLRVGFCDHCDYILLERD